MKIFRLFIITVIITTLGAQVGYLQNLPQSNALDIYNLDWTTKITWNNVVNIHEFPGETWDEKWIAARDTVANDGGGVVYFPAGEYRFQDDIVLKDRVVIRGAENFLLSKDEKFFPDTRFIFPKYEPTFSGDGTPVDTAFKQITLDDPANDSQCGIANISITHGAIYFPDGKDNAAGTERFVVGCKLEAAARAIPSIPLDWQHQWQRFTHRHRAAIHVFSGENALIANNHLANSQDHNFKMQGYKVKNTDDEIVVEGNITFDYDNRPGIVLNGYAIGAGGGNPPDGTPESHPYGFRTGLVIRDNFIFSTGGYAIQFTGDGTVCANNTIRFKPDVRRYTVTGEKFSTGSSTNGNRAVEMRGWRYSVRDNDYEVYSNIAADGNYKINDGEGLMHEDHVNSIVKDSEILNNDGNTYISIYKTGGIDGLIVKDNNITSRIFVVANRNSGNHFCNNVAIEANETPTIIIAGEPAEGNVIRFNINPTNEPGLIKNDANANLVANEGYEVEE